MFPTGKDDDDDGGSGPTNPSATVTRMLLFFAGDTRGMDPAGIALGLVFVLAGLGVAAWGGRYLRQWYHVRAGDPVTVREATAGANPVEVEGTVRATAGVLESPVFGEPCVAHEYKIQERRRSRRRSGGSRSRWVTIDSGEDAVPFALEDDFGRAHVDPAGASFSMSSETTREIDDDAPLLSEMDGFDDSVSIGSVELGKRPIRYVEGRLDVDGDGYVFGQAEVPRAGTGATVELSDGPETPMFLVSDGSEGATARRFLRRGSGFALFGIVFAAFGVAAVVTAL